MFNKLAVARHIKKTREQKGLTQLYVSHKLNISQNAYSKVELGHSRVTLIRLFKIAELLEIDPIELINAGRMEAPVTT